VCQTIFDEKVRSLGMFDQELVSKNATCTSAGHTYESLSMMTFPCSNHGVTVCGGLLYVMGRGNPSGSVCCFNPQKMNEALLTLNITDWNEVSHHLMKS
ncbi:unnamed protein product, partial [Pocillopora meandrina]